MRTLRWIAALMAITATAALAAWLLGFVAPLGPLGGGRLRGEISTLPADWSFADRVAEVRLETRGRLLPSSVTTWVLTHEGQPYIPSRNCLAKRWVQNVLAESDVRLGIGDEIYELRAVRDEDPEVGRALLDQMLLKYLGIAAEDARPTSGGDPSRGSAYGCVFRLEPRT